ncbi:MAG TPA: SDR family oxidoreductase [Planctomycetota bacterium]|nr:SDR family oxidoreductase [Planctomycetota bacterium]
MSAARAGASAECPVVKDAPSAGVPATGVSRGLQGMVVLVTGWTGFLGTAVVSELRLGRRAHVIGVARSAWGEGSRAADLSLPGAATELLADLAPEAVVQLAAVPDIAPCRADPALAARVNAGLPAEIARWCAAHGARLVHVSTDQVFDGSRGRWTEADAPRPLHAYGSSKLAGERAVLAACPEAVVLRPALMTGRAPAGRRSASSTLLSALAVGDAIRLFTDEIRTPVAVVDVARALVDLVECRDIRGLLHCGGPQALSRLELGQAEAEAADLDPSFIVPATRAEAGLADERPADLSLDSSRLVALLGWTPRMLA